MDLFPKLRLEPDLVCSTTDTLSVLTMEFVDGKGWLMSTNGMVVLIWMWREKKMEFVKSRPGRVEQLY